MTSKNAPVFLIAALLLAAISFAAGAMWQSNREDRQQKAAEAYARMMMDGPCQQLQNTIKDGPFPLTPPVKP